MLMKKALQKHIKTTFTNHGFIAQEVKEAVDNHPELKDGFKMWDIREIQVNKKLEKLQ